MSDKAKERADSGQRPTIGPSDASPNIEGLSKTAPRSRFPKLTKRDKEHVAQASRPPVEVDVSANKVRITRGARLFGTNDVDSIRALLQQVHNVAPSDNRDLGSLKSSLATVEGIAPRNALEGLLAVQMIGVHNLAMECLRRALSKEQTPERIDENVHRAVRLLRTFTSQMEALNRHRGKLSQQMVVSNVNVSDGGQAIVGHVSHDGRGKPSKEDDADKGK